MLSRSAVTTGVLGLAFVAFAAEPAQQSSLLKPEGLKEQAPASYRVKFETTKGDFVVRVTREWAPQGADRFYNLVKNGFYDQVRFFRAVPGFVVQFGISGDPAVSQAWEGALIPDDPVKHTNARGTITFATSGKDRRTTQVFINYRNNGNLDSMGFAAFGEVIEALDEVVDKLYQGYGERVTNQQFRIHQEGNAYLSKDFPELDSIKQATISTD